MVTSSISSNWSNSELDRKITLATGCFTTTKASELILKDRTRLSEGNALTVCNYIIAFKREVNPRPSYIKYTIQSLSELSRAVGIEKRFEGYTKDDVLSYFDSCRKPETEDPMHKWIETYNTKTITKEDIDEYVSYYSAPSVMRAGFEYYRALFDDVKQNKEYSMVKLPMPV